MVSPLLKWGGIMADVEHRYFIVVSDTTPDLPNNWQYDNLWFKLSSGQWYKWNGGTWQLSFDPITQTEMDEALTTKSDISHTHTALGDINFTGTVSADGDEGLTGERTVGGYTLTFKKGLLVGFQSS